MTIRMRALVWINEPGQRTVAIHWQPGMPIIAVSMMTSTVVVVGSESMDFEHSRDVPHGQVDTLQNEIVENIISALEKGGTVYIRELVHKAVASLGLDEEAA